MLKNGEMQGAPVLHLGGGPTPMQDNLHFVKKRQPLGDRDTAYQNASRPGRARVAWRAAARCL